MTKVAREPWDWLGMRRAEDAPIIRPSPYEQPRKVQTGAWVLSKHDQHRGFLRPLRYTYTHRVCQTDTVMTTGSATLWARDPRHAAVTWCAHCQKERPVGEFTWLGSSERVGS